MRKIENSRRKFLILFNGKECFLYLFFLGEFDMQFFYIEKYKSPKIQREKSAIFLQEMFRSCLKFLDSLRKNK
jgi:hypothetical protein